jgi:GTPase SAR1 family protein
MTEAPVFSLNKCPLHFSVVQLNLKSHIDPKFINAATYILSQTPKSRYTILILLELHFAKQCDQKSNDAVPSEQEHATPDEFAKCSSRQIFVWLFAQIIKEHPDPDDVDKFILGAVRELIEVNNRSEKSTTNLQLTSESLAEGKIISIVVLGLQGAGKSTMISVLKGSPHQTCRPTMGFKPTTMAYRSHSIQFFDVGGSPNMRKIWSNYFHDAHGVIFVIDNPKTGDPRTAEALDIARETLQHKYLIDKPTMILVNHKNDDVVLDVEAAKVLLDSPNRILQNMNLLVSTSELSNNPIQAGMADLLDSILGNYEKLARRLAQEETEVEILWEDKKVRLSWSQTLQFGLALFSLCFPNYLLHRQ